MREDRNVRPKVFGVGFHKTGTKSLAQALSLLGYRVTGPNGVTNPRIATEALEGACRLVEQFDAFQDNPWPVLYLELDRRYPGSKFILTVRPSDEWIGSVVAHFGGMTTPMREWIYGAGDPRGNETLYVERYERHNADVLRHFQNRPNDLLVLRITAGDGWGALCPFLDVEVPLVGFPHANKRDQSGHRARSPGT